MPKAARTYYYAVRVGKQPGIYTKWSECEKQVIGYPKSKYKKFLTKPEADEFLSATESEDSSSTSRQPATTTTVTGTFKDTSVSSFDNHEDISFAYVNLALKRDTIIGVDQLKTKINTEFEEKVGLKDDTMTAFTDGAASGNGTKRAHAGIGVYWGPNDKRNLSEPLEGKPTNQRAEIQAVIRAIETCGNDSKRLRICTDSMYVVKATTSWRKSWEKNNWKTANNKDVQNEDLFRRLFHLLDTRPGKVVL
ncbi:hypothetical protein INT44_002112, partial [Umbelopsis vinacea]